MIASKPADLTALGKLGRIERFEDTFDGTFQRPSLNILNAMNAGVQCLQSSLQIKIIIAHTCDVWFYDERKIFSERLVESLNVTARCCVARR